MDIKTLNKAKIKMVMYNISDIIAFLRDLKDGEEKEIISCVVYKSKNNEDFKIKLNPIKEFEHFIDLFEEEINLNIENILKYLNFNEYEGELLVDNGYAMSKFTIKHKDKDLEFHFRLEESIQDILLEDGVDPIIDSMIKLLDKMESKLLEMIHEYEYIKSIDKEFDNK